METEEEDIWQAFERVLSEHPELPPMPEAYEKLRADRDRLRALLFLTEEEHAQLGTALTDWKLQCQALVDEGDPDAAEMARNVEVLERIEQWQLRIRVLSAKEEHE